MQRGVSPLTSNIKILDLVGAADGMQEGQEAWFLPPSRETNGRNGLAKPSPSIWMEGPSDFHDAKMVDRRSVSKSTALRIGIPQAHHP